MEVSRFILMQFLEYYSYFVVGYFVAINAIYITLISFSFFHIRKQQKEKNVFGLHGLFASNLYYPISILAPAFNEEATVVASVKSLLQLRFPNYEVIVINDGSKDRTMDVLISNFKLKRVKRYVPLILNHKPIKAIYKSTIYPELIVVDKENGRKADALNAGINVCRNDLFCAIDADCVLEPDVLQNMLRCFIEDENTIAVGGIVRVANDCVIDGNEIKEVKFPKSYLSRIQVVEYLRAFLFGRVGWDYLDSLLIISGAFGIFDRNAVLKVGGYLHDTVGEDMELVVRLHKYHKDKKIPYRVRFLPEPVCWTEVPEDWKVLSRQRNRWQRGLADTLWRHKNMLFNPKYGRLGFLAMPFFLIFELFGPIIELSGYIIVVIALILGAINIPFALIFLAAAILLGMVLSVSSVLCEEFTFRRYPKLKDVLMMTLYAFLENFGFRQMHSWWRFKGIVDFIKGNKEWGAMTRKGLGNQSVLENLKPVSEASETMNMENTGEYEKDHNVNFDSYVESLDQRKMVAGDDGNGNGDGQSKAEVPLFLKILLSLIIVLFLTISIGYKVDFFTEPGSFGFFSSKTDQPEVIVSNEVNVFEYFKPIDDIDWVSEPYFFISEFTFLSASAGIYAREYVLQQQAQMTTVSTLPQIGGAGIKWSVGFGQFSSVAAALDSIRSFGGSLSDYEIISTESLSPSTLPTRSETGRFYYSVKLGEFNNRDAIDDAYDKWRSTGFDHLEKVESMPYTLTFGRYSFEAEAKLIAGIIEKGTGLSHSTILIEKRD